MLIRTNYVAYTLAQLAVNDNNNLSLLYLIVYSCQFCDLVTNSYLLWSSTEISRCPHPCTERHIDKLSITTDIGTPKCKKRWCKLLWIGSVTSALLMINNVLFHLQSELLILYGSLTLFYFVSVIIVHGNIASWKIILLRSVHHRRHMIKAYYSRSLLINRKQTETLHFSVAL